MEMSSKRKNTWGKVVAGLILAVLVGSVLYVAVMVYQFFFPPVLEHDEIQIGTQIVSESQLKVTDNGTHFAAGQSLVVLLKYAQSPTKEELGEGSVQVVDQDTGEIVFEKEWQERTDTLGMSYELKNQEWGSGSYRVRFSRLGKVVDEMELVLE